MELTELFDVRSQGLALGWASVELATALSHAVGVQVEHICHQNFERDALSTG